MSVRSSFNTIGQCVPQQSSSRNRLACTTKTEFKLRIQNLETTKNTHLDQRQATLAGIINPHCLPTMRLKSQVVYKLSLTATSDLPTEMVELTAASLSRSGSHLMWWGTCSHDGPAAWNSLPGYNQIQALNKLRNYSKLTCLHRHFNSFIVCRNMKCPPVNYLGGQ